MFKKRYGYFVVSGLLLIIILFIARFIPGGFLLVVKPVHGKGPAFIVPVKPTDCFTLHYFHSVNGLPVWEKHRIDEKGMIYIEEERFVAFNAGMGHWLGHGALVDSGEFQIIKNINRPIGNFVIRIAQEKQRHTIIAGDRSVNLSKVLAGKAVCVSVEKVSLLGRLWEMLFVKDIDSGSSPE